MNPPNNDERQPVQSPGSRGATHWHRTKTGTVHYDSPTPGARTNKINRWERTGYGAHVDPKGPQKAIANLPPDFLDLVRHLGEHGGKAYLVGGFVRDALVGKEPKDLDIELFHMEPAKLEEVLKKVGPYKSVGQSFGVYKVNLPHSGEIDIALPRRETKTGRGYTGFNVDVDPHLPLDRAAARRDFTVNSIMIDPLTGQIVDHYNGAADLRKGMLTAVGPAFAEDPLRVLRGMQFAARFNMRGEENTLNLSDSLRDEYKDLPKERVWGEWEKFLQKGKHPSRGIEFLADSGWLELYPELDAMANMPQDHRHHPEGPVLEHTMHVMDEAAKIADRDGLKGDDRSILLLTALCHDLGKALPGITHTKDDGSIVSPGHAEAGVGPTVDFLKSIGAPQDVAAKVVPLVREHMAHVGIEKPTARVVRRLADRLAPATIEEWERITEADHSGRPPKPKSRPAQSFLALASEVGADKGKVEPIVRGQHLIEHGLKPGPQFKHILDAAYDNQLEGHITPDNHREWLKDHIESRKGTLNFTK